MEFVNTMGQMSMFQNLRTGNIIIDIMISSVIAIIFSNIMKFNLFDYMNFEWFTCNENTISLTCTESRNYNGKRIMDTSETFRAVLHYIKANIKCGKTESLKKLSEYYSYEYDDYDEDEDKTKNNTFKDTMYLVNQRGYFTLDNNKDIYFKMVKHTEELEKDGGRKDVKTSITHTLKIISTKQTIKELQTYVDGLHKDYNEMINKQFDTKQHIFVYEGMDSSYNTKFKSYPFETTCDMDKVFFENKANIMKQIDFFKNNKEWYESKGKPYTLGICNYGLPGCGKTSFEKALCKYLNRHMIIVDFSRIKYMQEADDIFFSEVINGKVIPYDKRLYVFPDIDRMTELLYDTTYKKNTLDKTFSKYKEKFNIEEQSKNESFLKQILTQVSETNDLKLPLPANKQEVNFTPLNLSKLLNIIDGIPERTGQVIMMSANNIEKIDKALLRPGRIDCSIEFKKASFDISKKIIKTYFSEVTNKELSKLYDSIHYKNTPAELFNMCYKCETLKEFILLLNKNGSL